MDQKGLLVIMVSRALLDHLDSLVPEVSMVQLVTWVLKAEQVPKESKVQQ